MNHLSKCLWHFNNVNPCFSCWPSESAEKLRLEINTRIDASSLLLLPWKILHGLRHPILYFHKMWASAAAPVVIKKREGGKKLLRCTRCLACCGRTGRTSCSPWQSHNVWTVALVDFCSAYFPLVLKRCFSPITQNTDKTDKKGTTCGAVFFSQCDVAQ